MAGVNIRGLFQSRGGHRVGMEDMISHETTAVFAPVQFADDFNGSDLVIPAAGAAESGCKWTKKIVGTTTVAGVASLPGGIVACTLDATDEKQEAVLAMNDQCVFPMNDAATAAQGRGLIFEARACLRIIPTTETAVAAKAYFGMAGVWADGISARRMLFRAEGAGSGLIYLSTDDNSLDSGLISSGVTLSADVYRVFRIDASNPANVLFYIDGLRVGAATTFNMSSTAGLVLQPYAGVYKVNKAGIGTLYIDYIRVWHNRA